MSFKIIVIMKKHLILSLFLIAGYSISFGQDTFSIVAVDSATGEVGSAGASCLDDTQFPGSNGAVIISDILPGRGGIHTQAYYNGSNQSAARFKMDKGESPAEIIKYLTTNDFQNDSTIRQYGIVDFDSLGQPRSAGFTGENTDDYKNHIVGPNYSIQGNILLGPQILDSIEVFFNRTQGTLADKLMMALQGAKVPGADTRCLNEGVSSLSAFLRVARPNDSKDSLTVDLVVPKTPFGVEPIDSLQTLYNAFNENRPTAIKASKFAVSLSENPVNQSLTINFNEKNGRTTIEVLNIVGRKMKFTYQKVQSGVYHLGLENFTKGVYFLKVESGNSVVTKKFLKN
ncbi:MAG: putative Ntn-hydrolase superfamily protein [Sphingobacteriales bacterium]|jgi:uncharacterized Ntn-hydrolase superfamily protein